MYLPTGFIETFTGLEFDLLNPKNNIYRPEDVLHALAKECRYGGHCDKFYSVNEHIYIGTFLIDGINEQCEWCVHDSPEAYLKDIPTPLKRLFPEYEKLHDAHLEEICRQWGISYPLCDKVWEVDHLMFEIEQPQLMKGLFYEKKPVNEKIKLFCWNPEEAKEALTSRFKELGLI